MSKYITKNITASGSAITSLGAASLERHLQNPSMMRRRHVEMGIEFICI